MIHLVWVMDVMWCFYVELVSILAP